MKKILIVEDSLTIAKAIKIILEKEGMQTDITGDGRKVLKLVKDNKYNLVTLDLMMPDYSGKQVLIDLKQDPDTKNIPVLMLSAKADALRWDKDLSKCDKFMAKPFDNAQLVQEIKKLL